MIEIVLNQLSADGMKLVRVISDQRMSEALLWSLVPGAAREFATMKPWETAALCLFYGEVTYPVRGVVEVRGACGEGRVRRLACWRLMEGEGYHVSEIIEFLAEWYFVQTKQKPGYAFVRKMPRGVESGEWEVDGVMLFEAEWCLERCVMVGG
jgi:hypothetical protein